jgi:hypothetical protein
VDLNYISTIGMQNRLEMWRAEAVNVVLAKTE